MKFRATVTEAYEDEDIGVITVHFDDEVETYLQFQGASKGFEDDYYDGGFVYLEIIDQAYGAHDCFEKVDLYKDKIIVTNINVERVKAKAENIEVQFQASEEVFNSLKEKLELTFRDCKNKLIVHA